MIGGSHDSDEVSSGIQFYNVYVQVNLSSVLYSKRCRYNFVLITTIFIIIFNIIFITIINVCVLKDYSLKLKYKMFKLKSVIFLNI